MFKKADLWYTISTRRNHRREKRINSLVVYNRLQTRTCTALAENLLQLAIAISSGTKFVKFSEEKLLQTKFGKFFV